MAADSKQKGYQVNVGTTCICGVVWANHSGLFGLSRLQVLERNNRSSKVGSMDACWRMFRYGNDNRFWAFGTVWKVGRFPNFVSVMHAFINVFVDARNHVLPSKSSSENRTSSEAFG